MFCIKERYCPSMLHFASNIAVIKARHDQTYESTVTAVTLSLTKKRAVWVSYCPVPALHHTHCLEQAHPQLTKIVTSNLHEKMVTVIYPQFMLNPPTSDILPGGRWHVSVAADLLEERDQCLHKTVLLLR
jgi:hypothetical protein